MRSRITGRIAVFIISVWTVSCSTVPFEPGTNLVEEGSVSPEEQRLWHSAEEFQAEMERAGYLHPDRQLQKYLESVLFKLYPEFRETISIHVVKSTSLNAFALPNGALYINTGMLARLENEAQVATVLAHEGVHFIYRHGFQQRQSLKQSSAFGLGIGMVLGVPGLGELAAISSVYGFSKELEREADSEGFRRLSEAGYATDQAAVTFEFLQAEVDALKIEEPYFFSSHPRLQERIDSFRALAADYPEGEGVVGKERYQKQVGKLRLELLDDYLSQKSFQSLFLILERPDAFERYPASAWFYLGEAYRLRNQEGDRKKSLQALLKAKRLAPEFAPTYRALGIYYMKEEKPEEAIANFRKYLQVVPQAGDRGYIEYYLQELKKGRGK